MTLYSLNGGYPAPLAFDDMEDASGKLWTDLRSNPDGLKACGFVAAPEPPAYDVTSQVLGWSAGAWVVTSLPLDTLKANATAAVDAKAAALTAAGLAYKGEVVALDDKSLSRLTSMGAVAMGVLGKFLPAWPDEYAQGWIAVSNDHIPLATPQDGLTLASAASAFDGAIVQHGRDLKSSILAASDAAGVAAVDVTAGWPA